MLSYIDLLQCFCIVDVLSAKPHDWELLLQDEKQMIPKTQAIINTTFFILFYLRPKCTYFL